MKLFTLCAFLVVIGTANAAMPSSQIFLAESLDAGVKVSAITANDSYHNQPLTTPEGVYFTQELGEGERRQTDIFYYEYATKLTRNITNTPTSEYSPTLYPHDKGLSAIVVEASGKQRLWFYPFDLQRDAYPIYEHIEPVGYHAWGINEQVILFIVGQPHFLQFTDLAGHLPKIIAKDIDRSLAFNASKQLYSFTYNKNGQLWFATFSPKTQRIKSHFVFPKSVRDYIWLDDDKIAYALANRVYTRSFTSPKVISQWLNLTQYCDTQITRLSFSNDKLAFVCK